MKLGLIGVGNIGIHFANRLLDAGHELVVHDTNPQAVARLTGRGARASASARELACTVDVVLLCLPLPAVVKAVAEEVSQGTAVRTVVDLSTTGPTVTLEVESALRERGIALIGSPVSGGTVAAQHGTLAVMAAGPRAVFETVESVLQVLGKKIFYLGEDPSLGQTMKIVNNTLYAASLIASSEALVFGVKRGLDPQAMLDVINASSGRSFATLERIPQCVLDRSFPVRFTTELLHKDVKMCIDEAEKAGVPMVMGPVARQFLAFSMMQGNGARDNAYTIRHFEQWAGVEVGQAAPVGAPAVV